MPKQTYTDARGDTVPARHVKPYDKLRDQIAEAIFKDWFDEERRLQALKERTLERIERLRAAASASVDVPGGLGGKEGYIQFRSFDGRITIRLDNAKRTEFDERLQVAQALIMEAVREMTDGELNDDLVEIATKAFQPRRSGNLDMQRIRDLRSYNVKNAKWIKACEIIGECERCVGHRRYIRVSHRDAPDSDPTYINLDIAAV
jgi:hypothetical protein